MTFVSLSNQQENAREVHSCNNLHTEQELTSTFRSINARSYKLGSGGFSMGEPEDFVRFECFQPSCLRQPERAQACRLPDNSMPGMQLACSSTLYLLCWCSRAWALQGAWDLGGTEAWQQAPE